MRASTLGILTALFTLAGALPAQAQWDDFATTAANTDAAVHAVRYYGGDLYAGGDFTQIGGTSAEHIARWDGSSWSPVSGGVLGKVSSMYVHDDTVSGLRLYVAGDFTTVMNGTTPVPAQGVAAWDGSSWSAVGTGTAAFAFTDLCEWDAKLVISHPDVLEWDGVSWSQIATSYGVLPFSMSVADFQGDLHVGVQPNRLFRLTGTTWTEVLPNPLDSFPIDMLEFREDLYIGSRSFSSTIWMLRYVSGSPVWTTPDGPTTGPVFAFAEVGQCALYAQGIQTSASTTLPNIGRWNGTWTPLGTGLDTWSFAQALDLRTVGGDVELAVGGEFATAGSLTAENVAEWTEPSCSATFLVYCTAGQTSNGCRPSMGASGTPSIRPGSTFTLECTGVEGNKNGVFFYGVSGRTAQPWGNSSSVLCVKAPTQRMNPPANSGGNAGQCDGSFSRDWSAYVQANPQKAINLALQPGVTVNAQAWFRDPAAGTGPIGAKGTALPDALEFVVLP